MDDENSPSQPPTSRPPTLSQTQPTSEASDDAIAAPHLTRRSHSDSASATLERQLRSGAGSVRGRREPIPLAGETWKDFIRDTVVGAEAGPSSSRGSAAGPSFTGPSMGMGGVVRPGLPASSLSGPSSQRSRSSRMDPEQSRASARLQDEQDQILRRGLVHSRSDPNSNAEASRRRNKAPAQGRPRPLEPQDIESWKSIMAGEQDREPLKSIMIQEQERQHLETLIRENEDRNKQLDDLFREDPSWNNMRKRQQRPQVDESYGSYVNKRAAVNSAAADTVLPATSTSSHTSPVRDPAGRPPVPYLPQGRLPQDQVQSQNPATSPRRQSGSNIVLPPWQPDSEVESCTICNTPFNLWYRRHHCRKCGRVVCSSCSPHRITIPRQFIVQPPGNAADLAAAGLAARFAESGFNLSYGGAEVVRVCNPCVPDPNFGPPPQLNSPVTSPAFGPSVAVASNTVRNPQSTGSGFPSTSTQPTPQAPHPGTFSAYQFLQQGLHVPAPRSSSLAVPGAPSASRHNSSTNTIASSAPQHRQLLANPLHRGHPPPAAPPLLRPTRPIIREEDECPVCGLELPPRGPSGDETAREQHVIDCISSFSAPQPSTSSVVLEAADEPVAMEVVAIAPSQPVQPVAQATADTASGGEVRVAATAVPIPPRSASVSHPRAIAIASSSSSSQTAGRASLPLSSTPLSSSPSHRQRQPQPSAASPSTASVNPLAQRPQHHPARMLIYHATEKDCFDLATGEPQECVICFEEFEEGDEMARLECLCKFHRRCIRGWWEMKGGGMCPTHQLGVWG